MTKYLRKPLDKFAKMVPSMDHTIVVDAVAIDLRKVIPAELLDDMILMYNGALREHFYILVVRSRFC